MYTTSELRTGVERLTKHYEFMRTLRPEQYDHNYFFSCGAPSCNLGWATVSLPGVLIADRSVAAGPGGASTICTEGGRDLDAGEQAFRLSRLAGAFLFNYWCTALTPRCASGCHHDNKLSTTIRRLSLIIGYLRCRLSALESEQLERIERVAARRRRKQQPSNITVSA